MRNNIPKKGKKHKKNNKKINKQWIKFDFQRRFL